MIIELEINAARLIISGDNLVVSVIEGESQIMPRVSPLDEAKRKAGGSTGLARALGGLTPQAVSQWKVVPADRVLKVEDITGVSRHRLRPDIFGAMPTSESGQAA